MADELDWDPIRTLARRVLRDGEPLVLTAEVRDLLSRTALEVGLSQADATSALASDTSALELLRECSRRISEGSSRMVNALHRMYQHKRAGDLDSARQEMRDVLAAEEVPHYRAVAQGQLNLLDDEP
ncbi:DUSAM domain-containing protein [Myxococcus sp. MxC21-1]|uniref:DUSAM domain-containing protein n=1 Tax=Myxococcus sp. MxC21-1 TaxID=3041439 RepID=UPI0029303FC2|nr:DUSAM domain-containing protein [Myxococcus sp. MxC21-1]WNZ63047.1 DUSAM domain-containing protein [Myxococcus sp. MxC21-1]